MGSPPPIDLPPPADAPTPVPEATVVLDPAALVPAAPASPLNPLSLTLSAPSVDLPTPPDAPPIPLFPQVALSASASLSLPSINAQLPQVGLALATPTFAIPLPGLNLDFQVALPGLLFCGFGIPAFTFPISFSLQLPTLEFPPQLFFALSLSCDLSHPFSADYGVGGGRKGTTGLNVDAEYPDA